MFGQIQDNSVKYYMCITSFLPDILSDSSLSLDSVTTFHVLSLYVHYRAVQSLTLSSLISA